MSRHYHENMAPHFRSGNGAAWLDLISTLEGRYRDYRIDHVATPRELTEWLDSVGLRPSTPVTEDDVAAADRLREALHRSAVAVVRGATPSRADVTAVGAALAADRPPAVSAGRGRLRVHAPATAEEALARLARDAVAVLAGPRRERLRACGDDTCASIFLDDTGRRRWCTDERCGNRMRVRAHRARSRAEAPAAPTRPVH